MVDFFINKIKNKITIDSTIPKSRIKKEIYKRLLMLGRGYMKFRKIVFIGKKVVIWNKKNIEIGEMVTFEDYSIIDGYAKEKVKFGNSSKIGAYTKITVTSHLSKFGKGFRMGDNSSIGEFGHIGAAGGVYIGDNVIMGAYVSFHSENHIYTDTTKPIREQGVSSKGIVLGNNIWVGVKATFLDGAKVGNNCVVAAGTVVNKEFPDNCLIGGIPAKILKMIN